MEACPHFIPAIQELLIPYYYCFSKSATSCQQPCLSMPWHLDAKYNVSLFISFKGLVNLLQGKRMMKRRLYKASPFLEMFSRFANYKKPVLVIRLELRVHTLDQHHMEARFQETSRAALVDGRLAS